MAGRGPAPKPKEQRRNRRAPMRGEWVELGPLTSPVLGVADKEWTPVARAMWVAWRSDPVTSQYGPADVAAITELARMYEDLKPSEQRLRMDGLGLTPKGKRDLRLKFSEPAEAAASGGAKVHRLRVVAPEATSKIAQ